MDKFGFRSSFRFRFRGFTSFLLFFSFLISLVSGIVLYFPPQGKIAHWTHWTFWGLDKETWGFLHINSSLVLFLIVGVHLYYNWKVLLRYAKKKALRAVHLKKELLTAVLFAVFIVVATLHPVEPFSTIMRWNDDIKAYWASQERAQPPIPHAEELTVAEFCEEVKISLDSFQQAAGTHGWKYESAGDKIIDIARRSGISPANMYKVFQVPGAGVREGRSSGWGRKSVQQVCQEFEIDVEIALQRLAAHGIRVSEKASIREIANQYALHPAEVADMIRNHPVPATKP